MALGGASVGRGCIISVHEMSQSHTTQAINTVFEQHCDKNEQYRRVSQYST